MKMYRLMEVLQEMIEEETNYLNSSDPANDPIYFESAERKNALEICLNAFQLACAAHNTKAGVISDAVSAKVFDFMKEKAKKG